MLNSHFFPPHYPRKHPKCSVCFVWNPSRITAWHAHEYKHRYTSTHAHQVQWSQKNTHNDDAHMQVLRHTAAQRWRLLCWWHPLSSSAAVFISLCCQPAELSSHLWYFFCGAIVCYELCSIIIIVCEWLPAALITFLNETVISDKRELLWKHNSPSTQMLKL